MSSLTANHSCSNVSNVHPGVHAQRRGTMATPTNSSAHSRGSHGNYTDSYRAPSPASSAAGSHTGHAQAHYHPNAKPLDLDNAFGPADGSDPLDAHLDIGQGDKHNRDSRDSRASIGQPPPSPPLTEPEPEQEDEVTPTMALQGRSSLTLVPISL